MVVKKYHLVVSFAFIFAMAVTMVIAAVPTAAAPAETAVEIDDLVEIEPKDSMAQSSHNSITYIVAKKLGLSTYRAGIMRDAANMPDYYQAPAGGSINIIWSHAFYINSWGWVWWGDADDDYHDNLDGDSGEWESPEGFNRKSAAYYYMRGDRNTGDWYVGYASHYIEDISFSVLHSTGSAEMLLHHGDYENWIENNWETGHNFKATVESVSASSYYTVSEPKAALKAAAKGSNYHKSYKARTAWNNFKSSGFPTGVGSGNWAAVYYTKLMLKETTKWAGGTVNYALDTYNQW